MRRYLVVLFLVYRRNRRVSVSCTQSGQPFLTNVQQRNELAPVGGFARCPD